MLKLEETLYIKKDELLSIQKYGILSQQNLWKI